MYDYFSHFKAFKGMTPGAIPTKICLYTFSVKLESFQYKIIKKCTFLALLGKVNSQKND